MYFDGEVPGEVVERQSVWETSHLMGPHRDRCGLSAVVREKRALELKRQTGRVYKRSVGPL